MPARTPNPPQTFRSQSLWAALISPYPAANAVRSPSLIFNALPLSLSPPRRSMQR
jgi:hypothetical protein